MGSDAQCTTTIEQHDGGDESNSRFLGRESNLYSIISYNIQGLNTKKQNTKYNWYLNWQIMKMHSPKRPKQLIQNIWLQNLTHMLNTNSYTWKNAILLLLMCTNCLTEKFRSPLNELKTKLIEIGNPRNAKHYIYRRPELSNYWWQMETADGGTHENQVQANGFLQFAQEQCLPQYIKAPTRKNNILDVFLTINDQLTRQIVIT